MFVNLAVGDGTALRSENVQDVEKSTLMKESNDTCVVFMKSMKYARTQINHSSSLNIP